MAAAIDAKVLSGDYASASELIQSGVTRLLAEDAELENWLAEEVAPAYDALQADPSQAIGVNEIRAALATAHQISRNAMSARS